ncbi:MAG TPA: DUF6683 family protein, partial [Pyrinomonadaceae bacterium]|nr:DUF6683 family protein [Pyrinomonadaceae bacterium]
FYRTPAASKGASRPTTTRGAASTAPPVTKPADTSAVKFRPTGTYLKTKEFAESLGNTPAEREQYAKLMNAVLDAFALQSAKAGFSNDLGAALAFFIGENIRIYRGLPDLTDQQYVDLRNAIAGALISSGGLTNMTDRQKQEMYEALVAYTGITQFGYEQARQAGNDSVAKGYQKVAGQNLQTVTKIPPDQINYGPDGLSVLQ